MTRMFPFVTHTDNPIGGGPCPYKCCYCWATDLKNRYDWEKYKGPWRLITKELRKYPVGSFIFVQDMSDIGTPDIPAPIIDEVFAWIRGQPESTFLLLTKNPAFYNEYIWDLPDNIVAGATIETDLSIPPEISLAPHPEKRINDVVWASCNREDLDYFIAIEPIMKFSPQFVEKLRALEPWAVAVGYDNYGNDLPEPSLVKTEALMAELEKFTTVYRKTIREAAS